MKAHTHRRLEWYARDKEGVSFSKDTRLFSNRRLASATFAWAAPLITCASFLMRMGKQVLTQNFWEDIAKVCQMATVSHVPIVFEIGQPKLPIYLSCAAHFSVFICPQKGVRLTLLLVYKGWNNLTIFGNHPFHVYKTFRKQKCGRVLKQASLLKMNNKDFTA